VAYGAALVQSGRMSAGVRWIESAIRRYRDMNPVFPGSAHLALGEMFTEMALHRRKAPASLILGNLGYVLRNVPFAARKARRHLEEAVGLARKIENTSSRLGSFSARHAQGSRSPLPLCSWRN
jgi:hypothetical protein